MIKITDEKGEILKIDEGIPITLTITTRTILPKQSDDPMAGLPVPNTQQAIKITIGTGKSLVIGNGENVKVEKV
jgi:hypothetical protein